MTGAFAFAFSGAASSAAASVIAARKGRPC